MNTSTIPGFRDLKGEWWPVVIHHRGVERVRKYVQDPEGKSVDLLDVAERSFLARISGDLQTMVNTVFFLCYDDVLERFDLATYDREHAKEYAMEPDLATLSPMQKAANWFGERIGGDTLLAMTEAWEAAILNFIPNPHIREGIQRVAAKTRELNQRVVEKVEEAAMQELTDGLEKLSGDMPANLE